MQLDDAVRFEFKRTARLGNFRAPPDPLSGRVGAIQQRVFHQAEKQLTVLPLLRYRFLFDCCDMASVIEKS
jgi:hypothetical protein